MNMVTVLFEGTCVVKNNTYDGHMKYLHNGTIGIAMGWYALTKNRILAIREILMGQLSMRLNLPLSLTDALLFPDKMPSDLTVFCPGF